MTSKAEQLRTMREARAKKVDTSDIPEATEAFFKRAKLRRPKAAKKARPAKKKAASAPDRTRDIRPGTKLAIIDGLLRRKQGTTAKECMEACGWPAISMQQQARALGVTLKTKKEGRTTRFWA